MLETFNFTSFPETADNAHPDAEISARAREKLRRESGTDLLKPVAAAKTAATSNSGEPVQPCRGDAMRRPARGTDASHNLSYLQTWVNAGTSRVISDAETRNTVNHLTADFVKTASLFTGGKLGLASSFVAYGLDQASPHDTWKAQAADFALGGARGVTMKSMFSVIGAGGQIAPLKGALMGVSSGIVDEVFKRETFTDPSSLNDRLRKNAFNPEAIILNAAVFTAGEGLYSGINYATSGALARNALASGMVMGGSFGFVNGTVGEASRQMHEDGSLNLSKVVLRGLLDGSVSAAGAGAGIKVSDPVFQQKVKDSALSVLDSVGLNSKNEIPEMDGSKMKRAELHIGRAEEALAVLQAQQVFLGEARGALVLESEMHRRDSNPGLVINTSMQDAGGKPVNIRSEVSSWSFNPVLYIDSVQTDSLGTFLKSTHTEISRHESNPVMTGESSESDAASKLLSNTHSEVTELSPGRHYIIKSTRSDAFGKALESFQSEIRESKLSSALIIDTARMDAAGKQIGFARSKLSGASGSQRLRFNTSIR